MIHAIVFTNDDLNGSYQFEYNHKLNTQNIVPAWKDENGIFRSIGDLIQIVDDNNITLSCNEPVTGNQTLLLQYEAIGTSTTGRRLFEQELVSTIDPTYRLAVGKASSPTINWTLSGLITYLMSHLGFLKVTSNLSDLNNVATARTNLSVYSQSQVTSFLAAKATLYQSGSGSVLGVSNTSIYTPSANYHPATKKYVDDNTITPLFKGYTEIGDITSGRREVTIALGVTLSTANYVVFVELYDNNSGSSLGVHRVKWGTNAHTTTSFKLIMEESEAVVQNLRANFIIYASSSFVLCSNTKV